MKASCLNYYSGCCFVWLLLGCLSEAASRRRHANVASTVFSSSRSLRLSHSLESTLLTARGGGGSATPNDKVTGAASTTATTKPGSSSSSSNAEEDGPWWSLSAKKVMVAMGAFAIQQMLQRMSESGQLQLPPPPNSPPPSPMVEARKRRTKDPLMVKGRAGPVGLLEAPKKKKPAVVIDQGGGGATMPEHIFNLVKAIVGVGVLSLPAGIAAFGNGRSAIVPAAALITLMGVFSAIGFSWTGQVCAIMSHDKTTKVSAPTYRQAWSYSVSEQSSWIPSLSGACMTFLACLCFSMVLADSLTDLIKPLVARASRTPVLFATTVCVLMPLCLMKDLKSLAPFSLLGVLGMVYTGLAMAGRFFGGSYTVGSPLLAHIPVKLHPSFGNDGWQAVFKPGSVILISMLSTAYMCHFNAPKFYNELKDNTLPRFNTFVAAGFGMSILITAFIACIGFATFGANSNGFILNNYAPKDVWMSLSRAAVAAALTFSYPLCFQGLREGVLDVIQVSPQQRTDARLNLTTVVLLVALTSLAAMLKDVSSVLALTGATLGNLLCYVFPAIMYGNVNPQMKVPAFLLGSTGLVLGIVGVKLALKSM